MHITKKINQAGGRTLVSFEILPPVLGRNYLGSLYALMDGLMSMEPTFINITYHSRQQRFRGKGGDNKPSPVKKRPGTIGLCSALKSRFRVETIPHIICTNHDKYEIEDKLIELNYLGIDNILALRGDKLEHEPIFTPKEGGHRYAVSLVEQIVRMNKGEYVDVDAGIHDRTDFCIGVAGYPETHLEAKSYEEDLQHLKEKVDAGAHYVMTQMFFDNRVYFRFVKDCRKIGINVPIIPGIKNLTRAKQVDAVNRIFGASIPEDLKASFAEVAGDHKAEEEVGNNWCIRQSQELMDYGAPVIHYYTMSKIDQIKKIVRVVFPDKGNYII